MMITQRCLKKEPVIDRLNQGLKDAGICKQFSKVAGVSGMHTYEKLTFEGHQAMKLLAVKDGKMAVELILESMWPTGDSECEGTVQKAYVPRQAALWRQWSKVVELMTQRDPVKVRANVDLGRNGFERFGKECREFCRMYQAMFHEQHCRSFYLHTLLHHAGELMRALEKMDMTLGMMSNSGAERRHEFGRRACRKALASNGWRKKNPEYDALPNLIIFLTLKELLMWDYGDDLISHEIARLSGEGQLPGPRPLLPHKRVDFKTHLTFSK
jgi:hypothetical protein